MKERESERERERESERERDSLQSESVGSRPHAEQHTTLVGSMEYGCVHTSTQHDIIATSR